MLSARKVRGLLKIKPAFVHKNIEVIKMKVIRNYLIGLLCFLAVAPAHAQIQQGLEVEIVEIRRLCPNIEVDVRYSGELAHFYPRPSILQLNASVCDGSMHPVDYRKVYWSYGYAIETFVLPTDRSIPDYIELQAIYSATRNGGVYTDTKATEGCDTCFTWDEGPSGDTGEEDDGQCDPATPPPPTANDYCAGAEVEGIERCDGTIIDIEAANQDIQNCLSCGAACPVSLPPGGDYANYPIGSDCSEVNPGTGGPAPTCECPEQVFLHCQSCTPGHGTYPICDPFGNNCYCPDNSTPHPVSGGSCITAGLPICGSGSESSNSGVGVF